MPGSKSMHFFRVKRGRTLRDPNTGVTLGTPGQLVPKEDRDRDPDACYGPFDKSGKAPTIPTPVAVPAASVKAEEKSAEE